MLPFSRLISLIFCFAASNSSWAQDPPVSGAEPEEAPATFEAELKRIPYFQTIAWTTDATYAPFEILVQKQAVPEPNFERVVAQFYGPWLQQMAKLFEETVATPAKLEPALDPKPIRLIVLLTEGDYLNYSKSVKMREGYGRTANYDERIRSIVTCWEFLGPAYSKRYPVLRRLVFALLHQRCNSSSGRQPALWLREGLSGALAWHLGSDPATAFAKPMIEPTGLERLVAISQDATRQNVMLLPLRTMAGVISSEDVRKCVLAQAKSAGIEIGENDPWYEGYLYESMLWMHFLRREGAQAHHRAFEDYLRACMRGGGSALDLEKALGGQDLADLDREFFRWVYARAKDAGKPPADESRLATLFAEGSRAVAGTASAGAALAAKLAPPLEEPRVAHALALRKAGHGDIEAALAELANRIEAARDDPSAAAMRKDVERLGVWKAVRDGWLAEQVAAGAKIQLEREGKKIFLKAAKFENGVLQLEGGKSKEELPATALDSALLAGQMKTTPASAPQWARAYAMLLCADERWDKLLKDKSPESLALRQDAQGVYAELAKLGLAAEHLLILAQHVAPANAADANSVLERLHRVRVEVPTQPMILKRVDALLALARIAAEKSYDELRPAPEFGGKATWLDGTTLELTYEFNSESELADWESRPDDFKPWRAKMQPIAIPESQQFFRLSGGVWAGQGSFVFRHILPFDAPLYVSITLRHGNAANEDVDLGHFLVRICDEGLGNYIAVSKEGEIFVHDAKSNTEISAPATNNLGTAVGERVEMEVVHDGERVRLVHAGVREAEQAVGSRRSGGICLVVHTNRELILESIHLRGKLGAEAIKTLRERWISAAILRTGLK